MIPTLQSINCFPKLKFLAGPSSLSLFTPHNHAHSNLLVASLTLLKDKGPLLILVTTKKRPSS
ncbi:unnamed protein product [Fusarium graminearum]|uniref:Chromosome 1, complete genome n=1 Tax=Gibberella zeae (strain ATCC MYA-4620 / CBS 123657 / FGSC 9075 / NRRL 31084 / PH-1) TaxID=229533 RepID=A0A098D939_GIBZE|nr:unnamed protein product [Fusarium graminearum]CZS78732.1 unnamed protein product [Fusarium graminearum]